MTWLAAEEAAIVAELLVQKLTGNASESGFKPSVWQAVKNAVTASISGHGKKDVKQCKTHYQKVCCSCEFGWHLTVVQLKADYKIVKTLRGLSGFGWDEGQQMVTAPPAVWENYVQVCLCCSEKDILTVCFTQSHEKAKKLMTQPFLLYDDIAELCDDAIATGAGTFRPGYAPPASLEWDTDTSGPSFQPMFPVQC